MKYAIAAVVAALLIGAIYWTQMWMMADEGRMYGIAFGPPQDGQVEMHAIVTSLMTAEDPGARTGGIGGNTNWQPWIDSHLTVKDPAGKVVPAAQNVKSQLIDERKAGAPQTYVIWKLQPGQNYTFDYTPVAGNPRHYTYPFTAPQTAIELKRVTCALVK